jgi:TRAP-type uncharacterized transport system fused permease subunit
MLSAAVEGFFFARTDKWWQRSLLLIGSLLMIHPGLVTDVVGVALAAIIYLTGRQRMIFIRSVPPSQQADDRPAT